MALIKCPNCGKEISDKAIRCVHCGYVLKKDNDVKNKEIERRGSSESAGNVKITTDDTPRSPHLKPTNNKRPLIGILVCIIVALAVIIIVLLLKYPNNSPKRSGSFAMESSNSIESDVNVTSVDEANSMSDAAQARQSDDTSNTVNYNRTIYDGNDGTIVLEKIANNGLTLKITSKLKNRSCSFSAYSIALDGEEINLSQDDDPKIEPGETIQQKYSGTIQKLSHKTISLTGEFFDDEDSGKGQFEITNIDIGGKENLIYSKTEGKVIHDSETVNIRFIKCGGRGIRLLITNKTAGAIELSLDSLTVDGKKFNEDDLFFEPSEILGYTIGYADIDLVSIDEDIVPDQIKSANGTIEYYDENSGDTLEKFSFDITNQ